MSTKKKPLTNQQQEAAHLLASGRTSAEVAKAVGTTYTTVYRWQRRQEFIEYQGTIAFKRDVSFQDVLEGSAKKAVTFLADVLDSPDSSLTTKMKAADSLVNAYIRATPLMETGVRTSETQEVMAFLEALPD